MTKRFYKSTVIGLVLGTCLLQAATSYADEYPQAPEGYILIEQEALYLFIEEPDASFLEALSAYNDGNLDSAANEIHQGATFMRMYAGSLSEADTQKRVREQSHKLDVLAAKVLLGEVKDAKELKRAFAKADHVLARAFTDDSKDSITEKAERSAVNSAKYVGSRLEKASQWTGKKLEQGVDATVKAVNKVGKESKLVGKEVADWWKGLDKGVKNLERDVEEQN